MRRETQKETIERLLGVIQSQQKTIEGHEKDKQENEEEERMLLSLMEKKDAAITSLQITTAAVQILVTGAQYQEDHAVKELNPLISSARIEASEAMYNAVLDITDAALTRTGAKTER